MASFIQPAGSTANRVRIVVATSVMLTFISYWRAAAIVLNDLGSSAFYAAGIAEQAVGKSAPWFIVAVMLFSFTVRAVYVESCSMFVRGGVYRVVKEALGGTLAKVSVSALMFDYILTGPISGVSAGQYVAGLINDIFAAADSHGWIPRAMHNLFHGTPHVEVNWTSVVFAVLVTLYFWWQNTKGIQESSEKALRVMQITTVMVVILLAWSGLTLLKQGYQTVPLPTPENLKFSPEALGFLKHTALARDLAHKFGLLGILIAFGHSVLAMSGEESLAQVNRELAHPKLKNLKRAAIIIAIFSFVFTGLTALLFVMIIPDAVRVPVYKDNLVAGLAMYLWGPLLLRLFFRAFVVVVGFLILSGAVNTAIIGSNGVLNRISEDGVLTDWFRQPHPRFGTTYRIVNLVVFLQLFTILMTRGNVYLLGEAYAFGVIWSFTFNSLAMLVLRFKYKGARGWKVPPNLTIAGCELPVGLASVFLVLLCTAIVNLFTKSIATVAGVSFAAGFFAIFSISERLNRSKHALAEQHMQEHFQLLQSDKVERAELGIRPGNVMVTVRDYNTLNHLKWVLERIDIKEQDIVVMSARVSQFGTAAYDLSTEQIFSDYEQQLFTRAVSVAEGFGKHVSLLVVPARDPWSAIVQTANNIEASAVVSGLSSKMSSQEQAFYLGRAWEAMPEPKRQFIFQVVRPDLSVDTFHIGPHTPSLKTEDVHLVHRLWLNITREPGLEKLHHHEILTEALTRFAREYAGRDRQEILRELRRSSGTTVTTRALGDGGEAARPQPLASPPDPDLDPDEDEADGPPTPPVVGP
ncbi:MAG TPA: APC family permease [Terriglobales bacterium]|jgi:amino acid transporter|nr:APC family permease [Terriglobales bacterium]